MKVQATPNALRRAGWTVLTSLVLLGSRSAGAQRGAGESHARALAPVPLHTRWPSTTAIAIVQPSYPLVVEATSDGWVVLTPVGPWAESVEGGPLSHLQLTPSGVRQWASIVRSALALSLDSSAKKKSLPRIPQLGRGLARITAGGADLRGAQPHLTFQRCDGAGSYLPLQAEELKQFLQALDRAAEVAERGSPRPVPPTLDRPYYASELSCSAMPRVENAPARFPGGMPESQRRYSEVGVRFVVDTSGFVEPGSIAVLPGASPVLERATRELVTGWRYRPGVRGGAPVRQVIATAVVYDPSRPELPPLPPRMPTPYQLPGYDVNDTFGYSDLVAPQTSLTTSEGWVRFRLGSWNRSGAFSGAQEWFSPDSVDAWAARAAAYVTSDSARVRRPNTYVSDHAAVLGHTMGNAYEVRYVTATGKDSDWGPWTQMRGCGRGMYRGERFDTATIARYVAAARAARAGRATPREPADSAFLRGEVSCPAQLPPVHALQEELNVWRQQRGPIPPSMESRNARAEVLTSFVVDANGIPKPATLVAMPGSDPRAVAALRASLGQYRFRPAMRSGVPVSALVMHRWSFEPRPQCRDTYDGLDCARVYSHAAPR